jgi:superfamily II DNA helicase RecQ
MPVCHDPRLFRRSGREGVLRHLLEQHRGVVLNRGARDQADGALERALRWWRIGLARQQGVAPHIILHGKTLLALVAARPSTPGELLAVPGVGPATVEQYGPAILALMAPGC